MMLDLTDVAGSYTEAGRWWDSNGNTGELEGSIDVSAKNNQLVFKLDGDHVMTTGRFQAHTPTSLAGAGGGVTTSGRLYAGDRTIILEYVADVAGRQERNTDIWDFADKGLCRRGLIRQEKRTIWFEASMQKAGFP